MSSHEEPTDFDPNSDESSLSAAEQIRRFNADHAAARNLGGFGEEMAQCSRLAQTLVRTDDLTTESLRAIMDRAQQTIPLGSTYLLAFRVIEAAAKTGKLTPEVLGIVEECVMADEDPVWKAAGKLEEHNTSVMQKLLTNQYLFELMLPYISPDEFYPDGGNDLPQE